MNMTANLHRLAPLAVTMGDPAGIGPDITIAAWIARQDRSLPPFFVYGDADALQERAHRLEVALRIAVISHPSEASSAFSTALPVLPVPLARAPQAGQPHSENAAAVIASIEQAVQAVTQRDAAALVTNPIAKSVLYGAGFAHPGHTEFLGSLAERFVPGRSYKPVMMIASEELRVVPLTVHIPLASVPSAIDRRLLFDTVRTAWHSLRNDFGLAHPRIAVAGLNPHAGEAGTMGREEAEIIAPAIEELRAEGFAVTGPHPADTLFHAAARRTYDAAVCMYHDQALIPVKTLAFDNGVNVTLGLPFVRTSPDHGTAFDLAGTGRASPESFIASLKLAADMAGRRLAASSGFNT